MGLRARLWLAVVPALAFVWAAPARAVDETGRQAPAGGGSETLAMALAAATKALDGGADLNDPAVAKAMGDFAGAAVLKAIATSPCVSKSGGAEADCRLDRVEAFIAGLSDALHDKVSAAQSQRLTKALVPLMKLSPLDDDSGLVGAIEDAAAVAGDPPHKAHRVDLVVQSLDGLVKALAAKLAAIDPRDVSPNPKSRAREAVADIRKSLAAIMNTLDPDDRLIRVTGAWYGDLNALGRRVRHSGLPSYAATGRYCAATAAVRARCDGKPRCYEPVEVDKKPDGDTAKLDGASLCGYEPEQIVYATDEIKALLVQYQCLAPDDNLWAEAAQRSNFGAYAKAPLCGPGRGSSGGACVNYAILRKGADGVVNCQIAGVPAGGSGSTPPPAPANKE